MTTLTVIAIISVEIGGQALGLPPSKPSLEISRKVFEWAESKKTWLEVACRDIVCGWIQLLATIPGESTNLTPSFSTYSSLSSATIFAFGEKRVTLGGGRK